MWQSAPQINANLKSLPKISDLQALYWLSVFWRDAVYPREYAASEDWLSITALSSTGENTLETLRPRLMGLPESEIRLAFFGTFCHQTLFFDYGASDCQNIRLLLERELLGDRIRLPFRFGRLLYDRFNDTYADTRTDHVMSEDVDVLLKGTPVGVYQNGTLLSGPLGLLDSRETRWIPPSSRLPLWHCSDTGCNALHDVQLLPPQIPLVEAFSRIENGLYDLQGPASEWHKAMPWVHRWTCPTRTYFDLAVLVADCLIGSERTALLEAALLSEDGQILRESLARPPRNKRAGDGQARQLASRLTQEEQLQLLLVLPDCRIINLIDKAVSSGTIRIPIGETRRAHSSPPRKPQDSPSELSALGLRSVSFEAIVNLSFAIRRVYESTALTNELEWRLKADSARPTYEALASFLRSKGPADAVRELVLSSAQITKAICKQLQIPVDYLTRGHDSAIEILLWKLGFNPMSFDDSLSRFKLRLAELNEAVLASSPINTEDARERIRAAGVNVFVLVEDFLDRLISYNVWLLSSDHFVGSRFRYSPSQARASVGVTLGTALQVEGKELQWKSSRENPLGTLLHYLRLAANWISALPDEDRDALQRPDEDLPHFAFREGLPFPFRHTALWADAEPGELRTYGEVFGRITKLLEESELAAVRNGLDHFREPDRFPSADKLLACVARLNQARDVADVSRYYPKLYWLYGRKGNRFGSVEYEFRDYAGRTTYTFGPTLISGLQPTRYADAYVLPPNNILGTPNSALLFRFSENTEYASYWEAYPRRRRIQVVGDAESGVEEPHPMG